MLRLVDDIFTSTTLQRERGSHLREPNRNFEIALSFAITKQVWTNEHDWKGISPFFEC